MKAEARTLGLLLLATSAAFALGLAGADTLFFDFGPNDAHNVAGFREDFEVDEPTLIHWTGTRASVSLPFHVVPPYDVRLRYKRHVAAEAEVRFFLDGELVETRVVPQRDFDVLTLERRSESDDGPFELGIVSRSNDPRPLGLALDWMEVRTLPRNGAGLFRVRPMGAALAWVLSWVLALYAAARIVGLTRPPAFVLGLASASGLAVAFALNVNWPVSATSTIGFRFFVLTLALAGVQRLMARRKSLFASPEAKWVVTIVIVATALRLFVLFHPDFYYPDVRTHSKFVSLIWTEGLSRFFTEFIESQHRHLLGLQLVGDRWLAFPYPPTLYLAIYPLSRLSLPVEEWMKLVPTALLAVEGLLLFALAGRLGVPKRAALVAVALHQTAGVVGFRLAVASYAALFGHFWDTLAIVYLVFAFDRLTELRYGLGLYGLVTLSLLSYAGSALVLGFLMPLIAFAAWAMKAPPRRCLAIAGWSLAAAVTAFFLFYAQYIPELFSPATGAPHAGAGSAGSALIDARLTPGAFVAMSAYRLRLFYGLVFSLVAVGGLVAVLRSRASSLVKTLAYAVCGTYLGLNFLRAGLGATHIFQFSKDDLVIVGFVVLVTGVLVDRLWQRGIAGKLVGAGLVSGWMLWGAQLFAREVQSRFIHPGRDRVSVSESVSLRRVDDAVASRPFGSI